MITVFENHPKVGFNFASKASYVYKPEACGQAMLPDSQKLIGKDKIENFRCDILSDSQTLCMVL